MPNKNINSKYFNLESWVYPKRKELLEKFIVILFSQLNSVYIYGGGTLTRKILDAIPAKDRLKVKAIIDKNFRNLTYEVPVISVEEFSQIREPVVDVLLSHYDWEWLLISKLVLLGLDNVKIHTIFSSDNYCTDSDLVFEDVAGNKEKRRVVFITLKNNIKILHDSLIKNLPRDQFELFRLDMSREYVPVYGVYDREICCYRSLLFLEHYLTEISPDLIYVHDQIETMFFLPDYIKRMFPSCKVVWEPYDLLSNCHADMGVLQESKGLNQEQLDWFLSNEKKCLEEVDFIVHKEMEGVGKLNLKKIPDYYYSYIASSVTGLTKKTMMRPIGLVYAGTVVSVPDDDGFNGAGYLRDEFARILTHSNVYIDVFLNSSQDEIDTLYCKYKELEESCHEFRIFPRKNEDELVKVLSGKYSWGLVLALCKDGALDSTLAKNSSSKKLYTYFTAGLPVIITKEAVGMSQLVENYGLGIAVPWKDHGDIGDILDNMTDKEYLQYQENIRQFLLKNEEDSMIREFMDILLV